MPLLRANAAELFYTEQGDGPPVILLHGLGSCGDDWLFQTPVLARHFRVLMLNLRGHRPSAPIRGPITIFTLAADVAAFMSALGLNAAHIVGLSLGGLVGQQLAIDFGARVQRLVLCNTFARLRPRSMQDAYTLGRRLAVSTLLPLDLNARVVAADLFPKPDQAPLRQAVLDRIGQNDRASYRYLVRAIARFDTRAQLARVRVPTLVITGERDRVVPRGCQQQLVRGLPQVQWRIVPDSGHATPIDQPEEFNRLVLEFLGAGRG